MASPLINNLTTARKLDKHLTISQVDQPTLYAAIVAGTQTLPPDMLITLVATGGAKTTKITGSTEAAWSVAEGITVSSASVGDALKAKTQIAALTADATAAATDLPTVITLSNNLKTKLNLVIAALKA